MSKCLILTDGKAGHENQSKAFARALGMESDVFELHFRSKVCKALSYLLGNLGIFTVSLFDGLPPAAKGVYAAVIGTGSGTFYAAASMARRLGVGCGVVLYPRGYPLSAFDCVLAPSFDRPAKRKNVISIPTNLVASDEAFYAAGVEAFKARHQPSGRKAVAVIVGGPNKCSTLTAEWITERLTEIFAQNQGCEFWVTTSRRTPPEVERSVDAFPWDYRLLFSRDHFNPIPAFVKLADRLYVTAESTGMLSESCTFGNAEVFALDNLLPGPHKFRRFLEDLQTAGYVGGNRKVDLSDAFVRAGRLLGVKGA